MGKRNAQGHEANMPPQLDDNRQAKPALPPNISCVSSDWENKAGQAAPHGMAAWLAERLPSVVRLYRRHMCEHFVPKNLNIWYVFGALALLVLGMQLLTGLVLAMHYKADAARAFASVGR